MNLFTLKRILRKPFYELLSPIHRQHAMRKLRKLQYWLPSVEARFAVPFVLKGRGHFRSIRPRQTPEEIEALYRFVCDLRPEVVLEIGTACGGTLYLWTQAATDQATLISVDLPGGDGGGGYPVCRRPYYESFARPGQTIHLFREDSHDPATLDRVRQKLPDGKPIDYMFIDGDHSYAGVKADLLQYGPLVRPGGWIGFHDVMPAHHDPTIEVSQLWDQLKPHFEYREYVELDDQQWRLGIGLIQVPEAGFPDDLALV